MNNPIEIKMTKINEVKVGSKWEQTESVTSTITRAVYNSITDEDTIQWFRNLGGTERVSKSYTPFGYECIKLVSTSPSKEERTIRQFEFKG